MSAHHDRDPVISGRALKRFLFGLVGLLVALLLIGLMLPGQKTVERSATYNAKPAAVYAYLNGYKNFNNWSPWAQIDPNAKYTYSEVPAGVGAKMTWFSPNPDAGAGSQEIVAVEPYKLIQANLLFADWDGESKVSYVIAPEGEGTRLTWRMESNLGNSPINRWFGVMLDKMVGKDYVKGLESLKPLLEELPKDDIEGIELAVVPTQATPYLYVSDAGKDGESQAKLAAAIARVKAFADANGLKTVAQPIAMTRAYDEATTHWEFNAGIPVDRNDVALPEGSGLQYGALPAGSALRATHVGPYSSMPASYAKLLAYKAAAGLNDAAGAWEQYLDDPATVAPEKLNTHIYWPVR